VDNGLRMMFEGYFDRCFASTENEVARLWQN